MIKEISKLIANYASEIPEETIASLIEIPPNSTMGDYALPCFPLAKIYHKNPTNIAEDIKQYIDSANIPFIDKTEVFNGYLNIFVQRNYYIKIVLEQIMNETYISRSIGRNQTICIDYSSPNIAKNFHVGHLRTTVIGNSLYKIYEKLGYKVVRINHLGDWGTQFGKLILAYKNWSSREKVEKEGINELLRIYILFHKEAKDNPKLNEEARSWFLKMEQGDEEALNIWDWFKEISMIQFNHIYQLLGVEFDSFTGESFYMDKVSAVVKELTHKNLLEESQGAKIVNLDKYNMAPCLITKSDGSSIYPSRDLAAILYRKKTFHFTKCLYVTGLEQKLHFAQVFKVIDMMGYDWSNGLIHIPYGLVSISGEKLSTRSGNIVYAEELLKEAILRAEKAIETRNPNLQNKEKTAKMVGIGAIIFHDLFHQRIKNIDFSWDEVLSFEGSTGPYVQYTYARAKSILRKNPDYVSSLDIDFSPLNEDTSFQLVKKLNDYPKAVLYAADSYEPSIIARYVIGLAQEFNKFYHNCSIINSEYKIRLARLCLVFAAQKVMKEAMELLGIQCPEEM
ncbi:arginine--tRNA ligase [Anaerocolumna aminovalerica]|uniref:Arginine--tRNA ligase n=1 Tax=Anaerocolumna aminovalerica TaxID=1527 RepID=A0A1I5CI65_9FIRM|nr:arginine--tRNA ligase [Anaerocolumna aminovalerica]SFN86331.1 arginyl-tRNA synthetase [Anaerocolumna aminovalerica]